MKEDESTLLVYIFLLVYALCILPESDHVLGDVGVHGPGINVRADLIELKKHTFSIFSSGYFQHKVVLRKKTD